MRVAAMTPRTVKIRTKESRLRSGLSRQNTVSWQGRGVRQTGQSSASSPCFTVSSVRADALLQPAQVLAIA